MDYTTLKHAHAGLAYLTGLFFFIRFALFYFAPKLRTNKALKILPHIIDSFLLIFALMLVWQIIGTPAAGAWLIAKVIALVVYIGLGTVAIKRASVPAFVGAMAVFVYMLGVAKTKSVLSLLALVV